MTDGGSPLDRRLDELGAKALWIVYHDYWFLGAHLVQPRPCLQAERA
jgi:hypothetical protein